MMDPGSANILAYLALIGWFPVTWLMFATLRPAVAIAGTVIGGIMFLPELLSIDAPFIPPFDKQVIPPLAAFMGAIYVARKRITAAKPFRGYDLAFVLLLLGNLGTVLTNQDRLEYGPTVLPALTTHDLLAATARDHLSIYIPFLLGRSMYRRPAELLDFTRVFAAAGCFYGLLCLFEVRMSPQLHHWIYGYHQHDFLQTMRGGGYRPTVFMSHGISVARFMFGALLAVATLRRAKLRLFGTRAGSLVLYLSVVLLLCKSTGAIVFAVVCVPLVLWTTPKLQMHVAFALAIMVITFPILRATDIFPTTTLVEWGGEVSEDRANSLGGRFLQEDVLLERARERVFFGWGGYSRARVHDPVTGEDLSVQDGEWVIVIGARGAVGFIAWYILYLAPIFVLWRRFDQVHNEKVRRLAAGAALITTVFVVDTLPNSSGSFPQFFLSGVLLGLAAGGLNSKRRVRRQAVLRRRRRPIQAPPVALPGRAGA